MSVQKEIIKGIVAGSLVIGGVSEAVADNSQNTNKVKDQEYTQVLDHDPLVEARKDLSFKVFVPGIAADGTFESKEVSQPLVFNTLHQGINGGFSKRDFFVITNTQAWEQVVNDMNNGHGWTEKPEINFDEQYVIAAFAGFNFTQRSMIEVTDVVNKGDRIQVHVTNVNPDYTNSPDLYEKNPSSPYHLISVDGKYDSTKPVVFSVEEDTGIYTVEQVRSVAYNEVGNKIYGPVYVEKTSLDPENQIPFTDLGGSENSSYPIGGRFFFENQVDLDEAWRKLGNDSESPRIGDNETVLLVTTGPNGEGEKIRVKHILDGEGIDITVEILTPRSESDSENVGAWDMISFVNPPQDNEHGFGKKVNVRFYEKIEPYSPSNPVAR